MTTSSWTEHQNLAGRLKYWSKVHVADSSKEQQKNSCVGCATHLLPHFPTHTHTHTHTHFGLSNKFCFNSKQIRRKTIER